MILYILSALFIMALFPAGYVLGQRSANSAIKREREIVGDLQGQVRGLQSRTLAMFEEAETAIRQSKQIINFQPIPDGGKK